MGTLSLLLRSPTANNAFGFFLQQKYFGAALKRKMNFLCVAVLVFVSFSQLTAGRTISKVTKEEDLGTRELLENLRDALLMKERKEEEREEAEAREGEKEEEEKHLLVRVNKVGQ